jgi:hypothetical protein
VRCPTTASFFQQMLHCDVPELHQLRLSYTAVLLAVILAVQWQPHAGAVFGSYILMHAPF